MSAGERGPVHGESCQHAIYFDGVMVMGCSVESCDRCRMVCEYLRHEFCLNELTGKAMNCRRATRQDALSAECVQICCVV